MGDSLEDYTAESDASEIEALKKKLERLQKENVELKHDATKKYSAFYPKTKRGLLSDYPELNTYKEFQNLNSDDLLFAWYYSHESSPYHKIVDDVKRAKICLEETSRNGRAPLDKQSKYKKLNFSERVSIANAKMACMKTGPRVRAMKIMEKTLVNWEAISDVDASDESNFIGKDGVDWSKKKAFIEAGATISKNIGPLLAQVEGQFSISSKEEEEGYGMGKLINEFHKTQ